MIITIAISLEALVFIFNAAKTDISTLIYPTCLLIADTWYYSRRLARLPAAVIPVWRPCPIPLRACSLHHRGYI